MRFREAYQPRFACVRLNLFPGQSFRSVTKKSVADLSSLRNNDFIKFISASSWTPSVKNCGGPPLALPNTDSLGFDHCLGGPKKVWLTLFRLIKGRFLVRMFRFQPPSPRTHGYRTPTLRGAFQKVGPRIRYRDDL